MKIELLKPMVFGRGEFKVNDTVDINHSLARELISQGAARMPGEKKKPTPRPAAKKTVADAGKGKDNTDQGQPGGKPH